MNKLCLVLIASLMISCSSATKQTTNVVAIDSKSVEIKQNASEPLVGGWVPVFFSEFKVAQLTEIATGINEQRIKRAVISYPSKMQGLALQIQDYLQKQTNQSITMQTVELKDSAQIKYNLTQVVVTLYFR